MNSRLSNISHECDFCVVGGGLAGMCAAISAARHGVKVVIMQDRPMFGGNTSSEVRMWVSGAHGENIREAGILEELELENLYRNPYRSYPIWDTVLYEAVKNEENITVLLNCSCLDCEMNGNSIVSIRGWQLSTQQYHTVKAKYFADCSGDSILAPLTGAEYRMGREGKAEFNESIAPAVPDKRTMGLSCLIQARETDRTHKFIPPVWANKYTREDLPYRIPDIDAPEENFWYMELGGMQNTIDDSEQIRDELLKVAMGIWDYIKNSGDYDADRWELTFLGFLPGRRESRRYVGDYIMNENDVLAEGKFHDTVAYGGWTMDDHHPGGIATKEPPNIFHPAPSPFGIPYRSLYSKNIANMFFAGRNISVTHAALSATRVMATCALLGQAVGTAAYIANKYSLSPRGVYEEGLSELQYVLMDDDCYLPGFKNEVSAIMKTAKISSKSGGCDALINGHDRPIGDELNCWIGEIGENIDIIFEQKTKVEGIRLILDSDLNRTSTGSDGYMDRRSTVTNRHLRMKPVHLPETLVKDLKIELIDSHGKTQSEIMITDNKRRRVSINIDCECSGVRVTPLSTYGKDKAAIFSINVY